jgi:hypothetical protein
MSFRKRWQTSPKQIPEMMMMMASGMHSLLQEMQAESLVSLKTQPRYPVVPKLCRSKRKHRYSARLRADGLASNTKSSCKVSILNLLQIFQILICRMCSFEDFWKRLEKSWGFRSNSLWCLNPLTCPEVLHPHLEEAEGRLCFTS